MKYAYCLCCFMLVQTTIIIPMRPSWIPQMRTTKIVCALGINYRQPYIKSQTPDGTIIEQHIDGSEKIFESSKKNNQPTINQMSQQPEKKSVIIKIIETLKNLKNRN